CGTCVDVAGFLYERNPFVQFVSECSRVEVGAGQAIAPPGLGRIGAVRTILQVQDPSGIVPFRIGVEDTREREAQFPEAAVSGNGLKVSGEDGSARAIHGVGEHRVRSSPGAAEQDRDRKSTRLNSSHVSISYAVFCLKKKILG